MRVFWKKKIPSGAKILAYEKSCYNEIYVTEDGPKREMWFRKKEDFFLQSRINIREPDDLVLIYSKMMVAALLLNPMPKRILLIGLGGGTLSNFMNRLYPQAFIDVVEIDRKVIDLAKKFFNLNEKSNYRVHQEDGRRFAQNMLGKGAYDLIYLDAFKSGSIPFHLKTNEFYKDIAGILSPKGVIGSNLYGKSNSLKPNDWKTFSSQFKRIYCFEDYKNVATILLATNREETWVLNDFNNAATNFHTRLSFSLKDIAATYRAEKFKDDNGDILKDDFLKENLDRAIEKNNMDDTQCHLYPIKNCQ